MMAPTQEEFDAYMAALKAHLDATKAYTEALELALNPFGLHTAQEIEEKIQAKAQALRPLLDDMMGKATFTRCLGKQEKL